eukprot:NODE_2035_length_2308_cov_4.035763.p1 GENE.NODE_2035_length_2308_cov_4.035763~~NODE_2035_length_2308_cov_4.035763.p1  ORF type:complete len:586 (+),score=168.91 NODE_2035_length_2308_cov_4.035763:143-1900(+)
MALPLAAGGVGVLADAFHHPSAVGLFWGMPAMLALFAPTLFALMAWRRVSVLVKHDGVIRTTLPQSNGCEVFLDQVCDQIRAAPIASGSPGGVFRDWLATPAWWHAPVIAAVSELEHYGHPLHQTSSQSWITDWSPGPWSQHQSAGDADAEGITAGNRVASKEAMEAIISGGEASGPDASKHRSVARHTHPVDCRTQFVYQWRESNRRGRPDIVAGVVSLSWIDCAVPVRELRYLEDLVESNFSLSVQVGQLSGPVTSGRLGVCFDWGVRWLWRWPLEVALKAVVGAWAAVAASDTDEGSFDVAVRVAAAVRAAIAVTLLGTACAVLAARPYCSMFDNAVTCVGLLVAALTVAAFGAAESGSFSPLLAALASLLLLATICALLAAALALVADARKQLVLARRPREKGPKGCRNELLLGAAGADAVETEPFFHERSASDDASKHLVLVLVQGVHQGPVLTAWTRPAVTHLRLSVSATVPQALLVEEDRSWLSLSLSELMRTDDAWHPSRSAQPFAAIAGPEDKGLLLFADTAHNNGQPWRELVCSYFAVGRRAAADEAVRAIERYGLTRGEPTQSRLVILEMTFGE